MINAICFVVKRYLHVLSWFELKGQPEELGTNKVLSQGACTEGHEEKLKLYFKNKLSCSSNAPNLSD